MFTPDDERFMRRALELAQGAMHISMPNPRVGCVLVRDGQIIGEGHTQIAGQDHAEVQALEKLSGARPVAARRNGLCHTRTVQPFWPHPTLCRWLDQSRCSARGGCDA